MTNILSDGIFKVFLKFFHNSDNDIDISKQELANLRNKTNASAPPGLANQF